MPLTDFASKALLNNLLRGTASGAPLTWGLAIGTAAFTFSGGGTECSYTGYARLPVTANQTNFPAATGSSTVSCQLATAQTFAAIPASTTVQVTTWSLWDSTTVGAGNMWFYGQLTPTSWAATTTPNFLANSLTIELVDTTSMFTDFAAAKILNNLLGGVALGAPTTWFFSLQTAAPAVNNAGTEANYTSYARVGLLVNTTNFNAATGSGTVSANTNAQVLFPKNTGSSQSMLGYALNDAATLGNQWMFGFLSSTSVIAQSQPFFPAGGITATITASDVPVITPPTILPSNANYFWAPGLSFRQGIPPRTTINTTVTVIGNLQAALNACTPGQAVLLAAGTYTTATGFSIPNNVTLRGAGPTSTVITYTGTGNAIFIGGGSYGARINVTGGATQGSKVITVASTTGIVVGSLIVISGINPSYITTSTLGDASGGFGGAPAAGGGNTGNTNDTSRVMEQMCKVTAINGLNLTLERPLYITYANTPAISVCTGNAVMSGVEQLGISMPNGTPNNGSFFLVQGADNCWVTNCHTLSPSGGNPVASCYAHYFVNSAYACEFRQNYMQGSGNNPSGANYGVFYNQDCSECLAEDNIGNSLRHSFLIYAGASGNVFSYNYSLGNFESDSGTNWLGEDMSGHGAFSFMNLYEGNICSNIKMDNTHGGDTFNVLARNNCIVFSTNRPLATVNVEAIHLYAATYQDNIVANVIGQPGTSVPYTAAQAISDQSFGGATFNVMNYDLINGPGFVPGTQTGVTVPNSFFYTSKPVWWPATIAWPIIGPDVTPKNGQNPAFVRYAGGSGTF